MPANDRSFSLAHHTIHPLDFKIYSALRCLRSPQVDNLGWNGKKSTDFDCGLLKALEWFVKHFMVKTEKSWNAQMYIQAHIQTLYWMHNKQQEGRKGQKIIYIGFSNFFELTQSCRWNNQLSYCILVFIRADNWQLLLSMKRGKTAHPAQTLEIVDSDFSHHNGSL